MAIQVRLLNLHEFQSKKLMADNGIHVQRFQMAATLHDAQQIAKNFSKFCSNSARLQCYIFIVITGIIFKTSSIEPWT